MTQQALWLDGPQKPPTWVAAKLTAMAPGTLQLNNFFMESKAREIMSKLDNLRKPCNFSNKCNKKA